MKIELINKKAEIAQDALEGFLESKSIDPDDIYQILDTLSRSPSLSLVRPAISDKGGNYFPIEIRAEYNYPLTIGGRFDEGEEILKRLSSETGLNFPNIQPCNGNEYGTYKTTAIFAPQGNSIMLYLRGLPQE